MALNWDKLNKPKSGGLDWSKVSTTPQAQQTVAQPTTTQPTTTPTRFNTIEEAQAHAKANGQYVPDSEWQRLAKEMENQSNERRRILNIGESEFKKEQKEKMATIRKYTTEEGQKEEILKQRMSMSPSKTVDQVINSANDLKLTEEEKARIKKNLDQYVQDREEKDSNYVEDLIKTTGYSAINASNNIIHNVTSGRRNMNVAMNDTIAKMNEELLETAKEKAEDGETNKFTQQILERAPLEIEEAKEKAKVLEEEAEKGSKYKQEIKEKLQEQMAKNEEKYEGLALGIQKAGGVVGNMAPSIAGGQFGAPISMALNYSNAEQSAYEQARAEGATKEEARRYATGVGVLETATEMIGGKSLGKLMGGKTLLNKVGAKMLNKISNPVLKGGAVLLKDVVEEGAEEVISALLEPYIKKITYDENAGFKSFGEAVNASVDAFTESILPTLMFFGMNASINGVDGAYSQIVEEANARLTPKEKTTLKQKIENIKTALKNLSEEPTVQEVAEVNKIINPNSQNTDLNEISAEVDKIKQISQENNAPNSPNIEQNQVTNEVIPQEGINQNTANINANSENVGNVVENSAKNVENVQNIPNQNATEGQIQTKNELKEYIRKSKIDSSEKKSLLEIVEQEQNPSVKFLNEIKGMIDKVAPPQQPSKQQLERRKYMQYKNSPQKYDSSFKEILQASPKNKDGKRTKKQWLQVAEDFGQQLKGKNAEEIEMNAYKTWQAVRPNTKESLNRYGSAKQGDGSAKYVPFTLDEWIEAINRGVQKATENTQTANVQPSAPTVNTIQDSTMQTNTPQENVPQTKTNTPPNEPSQIAQDVEAMNSVRNTEIPEGSVWSPKPRPKTTKLEGIAEMTEKDAELPNLRYQHLKDRKTTHQRKFFENVETSKVVSQEVKDRVEMTTYKQKHNADTLQKASEKLDKAPNEEATKWFKLDKKKATDADVAMGAVLLERYQAEGKFEEAVDVIQKLADIGTEAGRTVQMYSIFQRLTPDAMKIYQQRKLNSAFETLTKKKTGEWVKNNADKFKLTGDDLTFITAKVQEAQQALTERDKQIALAEIEKRINDKLPPEAGQSIKAFRRIAMLFNPKTQVRNVVGNTTVMPLNTVADLVGTQIDKIIAKKTGVRTTTAPNIKKIAEGFKKGWKETWDDYKRGIRTTPTGERYEITSNVKSFNENTKYEGLNAINRKLNKIDNLLSTVLTAGDRPFYEASFQNALEGLMKANNVDVPTQEMIDIASNIALQQTWQDSNEYTQAVLWTRKALNKLSNAIFHTDKIGFGLGDLIIPFAKTPANLTKAMIDYSPAGLIPALINYNDMSKAISRGDMTMAQQKKFVSSMGKAVAGTLFYTIAGALAESGAISGSSDDDKDVANFEKNILGIQPYSIKIGDKTFSYNWAQPLSAPLAIMADAKKMREDGENIGAMLDNLIAIGGDQLVENSFLQGIRELFADRGGDGSLMSNLVDAVYDTPAQFTPTLFGQVATLTDPTKRQTFEKDRGTKAINSVLNKIPGAKDTLAPQVNTFGEEVESYGGDVGLFNVFLNPANVSSTNATDTQKELYSLYEETKDKTIFPKQAPYTIGEKDLTSHERAEYQKTSGQYVTRELDALFDSKFYESLDNEDKVYIVNRIVNDADLIAQSKWKESKNIKELQERQSKLEKANIPMSDYYLAYIAYQNAEGKKNLKGETISGTKKKAQQKAIREATDLTRSQEQTLYGIFNIN